MNEDVDVTVVVVPRESFAQTGRCLTRLLQCTPSPRRVVVVDGGSPEPISSLLEHAAFEHDLTLVRSDHPLTPNEARNCGLEYATTEWVAIVDNDAYVPPGWLDRLRECGDRTGAPAVAPVYYVGEPGRERLHHAGGDYAVARFGDRAQLVERQMDGNQDPTRTLTDTQRRECGAFEFHAVLLRQDALKDLLPLDEGMRSILEHVDASLILKQGGHAVWYEPTVAITYIPSMALRGADFWNFVVRWSDDWNERSATRFCQKWGLSPDDPQVRRDVEFGAWVRSRAYLPYRSPLGRLAPRRGRVSRSIVDRIAQRAALGRYQRQMANARPPRVVHRASWMPDIGERP